MDPTKLAPGRGRGFTGPPGPAKRGPREFGGCSLPGCSPGGFSYLGRGPLASGGSARRSQQGPAPSGLRSVLEAPNPQRIPAPKRPAPTGFIPKDAARRRRRRRVNSTQCKSGARQRKPGARSPCGPRLWALCAMIPCRPRAKESFPGRASDFYRDFVQGFCSPGEGPGGTPTNAMLGWARIE